MWWQDSVEAGEQFEQKSGQLNALQLPALFVERLSDSRPEPRISVKRRS
jgi:hypothetical protein